MPTRKALITYSDHEQLTRLLDQDDMVCIVDPQTLRGLRHRIATALLIDDARIPGSVVTMESVVLLRDQTSGDEDVYTLVFPQHANIGASKLSVFAPVGVAILGRHIGQTVRDRVPYGERKLKIVDILFQPETDDRLTPSVCRVPQTIGNRQPQSVIT